MWSIFCTIKRSWSQHFVEQFSALIILTMSYSALLFIALALTNVQNLFEMWGQVNQMTVYFNSNIEIEDKQVIMKTLVDHPMVSKIREVSSQESAQKFEERFAKVTSQKIDADQVAQFFPRYLEVNLDQTLAYKAGGAALDQFVAQLKQGFDSIKNVSYGKSWLQRYVGVLAAVQWAGWFLIVSFLIASVVVSSSVIKTILFSRRDEIEILEFVGADDSTIYLPQIINTFVLATLAFTSSVLLNSLLFSHFKGASDSVLSVSAQEQLRFISPGILLGLTFVAVSSVTLYSTLTIFNLLPRRKKALLIKEVMR